MENLLALGKGLNFVSIEPRTTRNDRDLTLDVEFLLTRGPPVRRTVDIEVTTTTGRGDHRGASKVTPLIRSEIRRAAERIQHTWLFSRASVETEQGTAPDQVIVNVEEATNWIFELWG
jgi:outer membrane protein insertion porin family